MTSEQDERLQLLCPAGFPVPPGTRKWVLEKGDKGDKGDRGERGVSRLPKRQAQAIVLLFLINTLFLGVGFFWLTHIQAANNDVRCESLAQIVTIPIPVPTAGNPSRQWVADYEQIERRRGVELGCVLPPPRYVKDTGR